ncbi:chromate transporter [Bacillaceae bacterium SIJ1]|uniref:chromate transporter n=1 Tax=Litoribacterium kuwaitense TaxID=1398745 RepID=UPI0013EC4E6F|nr:chromate transporter [Litoribacterium kuwaitense]NGP45409.1 chromate transporter [Litoribacterium kuwaitense]
MTHLRAIALSFFKIGMLGYGGGPSSIPLVYQEVVIKHKWLDENQFSDILALSNALPGPLLTKMAGYIGFRLKGIRGLFTAILACVLPTVFLIIMLLVFFKTFQDNAFIQGMTKAVGPVIGVMLGVMAWQFAKKGHDVLGRAQNLIILGGSAFFIFVLNWHPAILIAACIAVALYPRDHHREKGGASS